MVGDKTCNKKQEYNPCELVQPLFHLRPFPMIKVFIVVAVSTWAKYNFAIQAKYFLAVLHNKRRVYPYFASMFNFGMIF